MAIQTPSGFSSAALTWISDDGLVLDLPAGVVLVSAQRINNQGQILVWAQNASTFSQFLLTPVSGR